MKFITNLFDFYIDASIHVALAVCSLVLITGWELDIPESRFLLGFVFFGTISGYNFVKFAPVAGLQHHSKTRSLKTIQLFSFVCFGIAGYCIFQLPSKVFYVTAIFGLLTLFYAVPFVRKKNLRRFSGLKILVVALVWAGVTVCVPWANASVELTPDIGLIFIQRLFLVIVLTLPFEIRDLQYDLVALRTLPQQLGIKKTKALGILLLILVVSLEVFKDELSPAQFISLTLTCFTAAVFLMISRKEQSQYFASFWVEAIPLLWLGSFFLLRYYL